MKINLKSKISRLRAEKIRLFSKTISIGAHCKIGARNSIIATDNGDIRIDDCFLSNDSVHLQAFDSGELIIHDNVFINRNSSVIAMNHIEIGSGTTIGHNVVIIDHDHDFRGNNKFLSDRIIIGNNVWIGANVVILRGSCIEDNVVIGAGSVVKGKIKQSTLFYQKRISVEKNYSKQEVTEQ